MCVKGVGCDGVGWMCVPQGGVQLRARLTAAAFLHRCSTLTDDCGLQVHEHGPWHMFASAGLAEERVEAVVASANGLVRRHLSVRLNAMFQAVQLPASVADLHTCLADVHRNTLPL